jgi:hypothetical protein
MASPALARYARGTRLPPLAAGDLVLVVVEEFEISLPQLEQSHVRGRAHVERAAVVEQREDARGIDGGARDRLVECHAPTEQLRHAVGKVDDPSFMAARVPVGRECIRPETGLHDRGNDVPPHVPFLPIANVEPNAAAARR